MFERFTDRARQVTVVAREEAERLGHPVIGTEHVLLGLLGVPEGVAAGVLTGAGLTPDDVRADIDRHLGWRGSRQGSDADALRVIGIDIDAIREQVEASFGPGALDRPLRQRWRRGWGRRRRRACDTPNLGRPRFGPRAKKVLELSLREALALGHRHIGTEHILLGLLREGEGLASLILVDRGLRPDDLRRQVLRRLDP